MAPIFCKDCSIKISGFFKKKFTCQLCLNRFCDKCFSKVKENAAELSTNHSAEVSGQNCLACIVLQCGTIKREQLFLLRNKQLAIYLNERNISTVSCSEKYHLVDLIMEFAETHGIKSGDDMESDVMHRDHVEELRRKAELLRVQEDGNASSEEGGNEQPGSEDNTDQPASEDNNEHEQPFFDDNAEQPHFSGDVNEPSRNSSHDRTSSPDIESADAESDDAHASPTDTSNINENTNSGAGHQEDIAENVPPNLPESGSANPTLSPHHHQASGKWYSVEDIQMEGDISSLSVLELKQILAANFIDYRGCCEKKELINKVTMLYQSQQAEQSEGGEGDRDLCKICMDRIIDCVFLDCAHLVACTKCGKKLSECPICRAFIVRVVHIFRA